MVVLKSPPRSARSIPSSVSFAEARRAAAPAEPATHWSQVTACAPQRSSGNSTSASARACCRAAFPATEENVAAPAG